MGPGVGGVVEVAVGVELGVGKRKKRSRITAIYEREQATGKHPKLPAPFMP